MVERKEGVSFQRLLRGCRSGVARAINVECCAVCDPDASLVVRVVRVIQIEFSGGSILLVHLSFKKGESERERAHPNAKQSQFDNAFCVCKGEF